MMHYLSERITHKFVPVRLDVEHGRIVMIGTHLIGQFRQFDEEIFQIFFKDCPELVLY